MRVVVVSESFLPRVNGVSNSVVRVSRALRQRGHDVLIIAPDAYTAGMFEDVPVSRVRSVVIPGIHETDVALVSTERVKRELEAFNPDVIHLASPFVLGAAAARAARMLGIPTVAIFQTDLAGFARHYNLTLASFIADSVIRKIHEQVDLNLVPSSDSAFYLRSLGVTQIERWGRGVDVEMFNPRWRERNLYGDPNRIKIGFLGRLAPEKSIEMLKFVEDIPNVQLVLIGDGPEREALQELLPTAIFTGRLGGNDLSKHVASLDIMITPGERETFCQVIQEAMAAGLPVVAPAVGGPRDLVMHGINGYLYEPGNGQDLRRYINKLVTIPGLRQQMAADARLTVQDRTWERITDELLGHYETVITAAKSAQRQSN